MALSSGRLALAALVAAAFSATAARAQVLTGRVVNPSGVGVSGVNIDALDQGGNDVPITHDGTDANGNFSVNFPSNGTFDVYFYPPLGSRTAPVFRDNVVVSGTTNIGDVAVPFGVLVQGKSVDQGSSPVIGAKIKMRDNATQSYVLLSQSVTDSSGSFANVVVAGNYDLLINTLPSNNPSLAPRGFYDTDFKVDTNLGNIVHPPGFHVTAHVQRSSGAAVANADFDFHDSTTGEKQYTPNDVTDANGNVDMVVRAGTFDVKIDPLLTDKLVSKLIAGVAIGGATNLGTIVLDPGFYLSGTVRDLRSVPVATVDLDVLLAGTSTKVPITSSDDTDASGFYKVVVPAGTFDLVYMPPVNLPLATNVITGRTIGSDTTIDVTLLDCSSPTHYGTGTKGSGGFTPQIGITGATRLGNTITLDITQGLGGAQAFLFLGLAPANIQGSGWTLLVSPSPLFLVLSFKLGGTPGVPGVGAIHLPGTIPANPAFSNLSLYMQAATLDPGAAKGIAASDGLNMVLCR